MHLVECKMLSEVHQFFNFLFILIFWGKGGGRSDQFMQIEMESETLTGLHKKKWSAKRPAPPPPR